VLALERQVALELQHDGGVLQSRDLTDARYVIDHQPMRRTYVLGAQKVDAENLRWA